MSTKFLDDLLTPCHPRCSCLSFFSWKEIVFWGKHSKIFLHIIDLNGGHFNVTSKGSDPSQGTSVLSRETIRHFIRILFLTRLESRRALWRCIETAIWTSTCCSPLKTTIWRKMWEFIFHWIKKDMNNLDDMGRSKLSGNFSSGRELLLYFWQEGCEG